MLVVVQMTVVVPTGNVDPDCGEQVTVDCVGGVGTAASKVTETGVPSNDWVVMSAGHVSFNAGGVPGGGPGVGAVGDPDPPHAEARHDATVTSRISFRDVMDSAGADTTPKRVRLIRGCLEATIGRGRKRISPPRIHGRRITGRLSHAVRQDQAVLPRHS